MQKSLNNGYTARTTTAEVIKNIDLTDKIVIITGGSSGLGLETTRTLAMAGAKVVVPARSISKASEALEGIPNVVLYPRKMDLSKLDTVKSFVTWFQKQFDKLDLLINCAGIMASPSLERDELGNELQVSVNYLGHYNLINDLIPQLKKANGARVINLSSRGHWYGPFNFDDPNFRDTPYDKWVAYGQAKTAVTLLTVAVDYLYKDYKIRSFSVHPGSIVTNLSRNLSNDEMASMGAIKSTGERGFDTYDEDRKTIPEGAATIVWCATSPELDDHGGQYCENCNISSLALSENDQTGVKSWAVNKDLAIKLWNETNTLFQLN